MVSSRQSALSLGTNYFGELYALTLPKVSQIITTVIKTLAWVEIPESENDTNSSMHEKEEHVPAQGVSVAPLTHLLLGGTCFLDKITLPMTTVKACDYSRFSVLIRSWALNWAAALPDILSWFEIITVDSLLYFQPYLLWGSAGSEDEFCQCNINPY